MEDRASEAYMSATPHTRGSTMGPCVNLHGQRGYPAYAGIDRPLAVSIRPLVRLPRIRGDRPPEIAWTETKTVATPHTRGST